jgi:alpha-ribazole phosphatase
LNRTRVFLWRHPEVQGRQDGKFWGQTDVALTRRGKLQMKAAAKRMAAEKLAAIYCSDLRRTVEVAEAVGRVQKPRIKPERLKALRELDLGRWEGLSYQEIDRKHPGALQARAQDMAAYRIPDGESLEELAQRAIPAFRQLVDAHPGKDICLICHAGVNRVILSKLLGAPLANLFRLEQDYACLNIIEVYEDGIPVIKLLNQGLGI